MVAIKLFVSIFCQILIIVNKENKNCFALLQNCIYWLITPFLFSNNLNIHVHTIICIIINFLVNCWPSENGEEGCDVNIEYELEHSDLELNNVEINIPLPLNSSPIVSECDGQYDYESRKNLLVWSLPIIDISSKSGSMEFAVPNSRPTDFFPLQVSFTSKTSYAKIKVNFNQQTQ